MVLHHILKICEEFCPTGIDSGHLSPPLTTDALSMPHALPLRAQQSVAGRLSYKGAIVWAFAM